MVGRFIDRIPELESLDDAWRSGRPELVVLHGRRRVGKSALLTRFARGKPVSYYVAAQQLERDQLGDLGRALGPLSTGFRRGRPPRLALRDWDELLSVVADAAERRRVGLILDEFPYLVDANRALPSILQRWWDRVGSRSDLVVILAGSQQSMLRRLVSAEGALYGRPTRRLWLRPMDHYYAGRFVGRWSPADRVRAFAIAGGIPDYLEEFNDSHSLLDELLRLAFTPDGRLYREASDLLRSEFTEPRTYETILRAIAQGQVSPGTIADQAGLSGANRVNPYLERLIELDLVERRVLPLDAGAPRPRTSQYVLADQYLRFYFALVDPWRSAIQLGQGESVLAALWGEELDRFVSRAFEEVARQHLARLSGAGRIRLLSSVGFWWFNGGDIDAVGVTGRELAVAASAKWTREYMKPADLADLRRDVALVAPGSRPELFLFSRSGFDRHLSSEVGVTRVSLSDLYRADLEYERRRSTVAGSSSLGAPASSR